MCVRVFGKQGELQRVRIIISTPSPLSQHLKRGFSLSPAPHHPARIHGCQETSSDTGAHGPERLQTDTQADRPHSTTKYGKEKIQVLYLSHPGTFTEDKEEAELPCQEILRNIKNFLPRSPPTGCRRPTPPGGCGRGAGAPWRRFQKRTCR